MRKYLLIYTVGLLGLLSFITQASDEVANRSLEKLHKIVSTHFSPVPYSIAYDNAAADATNDHKDMHRSDYDKRHSEAVIAYGQTSAGHILYLPPEILLEIIGFLNAKTFYRLKETCKLFHHFFQARILFLNDYCLTETRPHSIPREILCSKALRTKDGIFQLANLYSVSVEDLRRWFGEETLREYLNNNRPDLDSRFPSSRDDLEAMSEEALGELYPLYKVGLAAYPFAQAQPAGDIRPFLRGFSNLLSVTYYDPNSFSYGKQPPAILRLLALDPLHPDRLYGILHDLFNKLVSHHDLPLMPNHPIELTARELFMAGQYITEMNEVLFIPTPARHGLATQILQWLIRETPDVIDIVWGQYWPSQALRLGREDIALEALHKISEFPDTPYLTTKTYTFYNNFLLTQQDKGLKEKVRRFSAAISLEDWRSINANIHGQKLRTFGLIMLTGQTAQNAAFPMMLEETLSLPIEEFINLGWNHLGPLILLLPKNNFTNESRSIVRRLLRELTAPQLYQVMSSVNDELFDVAFDLEPEQTIGFLKTFIETPEYDFQDRMDVLVCLARLKGKEEVDFIESMLQSLSLEKQQPINFNPLAAIISYYIGNRELCQEYWSRGMDVYANNPKIVGSEEFAFLLKALLVSTLEELRKSDPFEKIPLYLAPKDNPQLAKA